MTWMREGLLKGNWWSVGYPPAKANLIVIRTKKKTYLNLLTNYASVAATQMMKHKRNFPANNYIACAPWAQKNYNEFKCGVDKWNKAHRLYARQSRYIAEEVMYAQFFLHAYLLQSYVYWQATTGQTKPQLTYYKELIHEIVTSLGWTKIVAPVTRNSPCWPVSRSPQKQKCQFPPCRNSTTLQCQGCKKWGCAECLRRGHFGE